MPLLNVDVRGEFRKDVKKIKAGQRSAGRIAVLKGASKSVLETLEGRKLMAGYSVTTVNHDGTGSLASAINAAVAANDTAAVITFSASIPNFSTIQLTSGDAEATAAGRYGPTAYYINGTAGTNITIDATNAPGLTIDGAGEIRQFAIAAGNSLTLKNLTLNAGHAQGGVGGAGTQGGAGGGGAGLGGAVLDDGGSFTANGVLFSDNVVVGGKGGGYGGGAGGGGAGGGIGADGDAGNGGGTTGRNGGGDGGVQFGSAGSNGTLGGGGGGGGFTIGGGIGGFGGGGGGGGGYAGGNVGGFGGGNAGTSNGDFGTAGGGGAGLGGALFANGGDVSLTNSTFAGNSATGGAGGVFFGGDSNGIAGSGFGGAIFVRNGSLLVEQVTISGNTAAQGGRGVYAVGDAAPVISGVMSTIIAQSDKLVSDYQSSTINGGSNESSGKQNLIGSIDPADPIAATIVSSDDPQLGDLFYNGGPTLTIAPAAGSPAVDVIAVGALPTDERGAGFTRTYGRTDIGAFERQPTPQLAATTISIPSPSKAIGQGGGTITATVGTASAQPLTGIVIFYIGSTKLGVSRISGNTASISTAGLSHGTYPIHAVYSGDFQFASAVSNNAAVTIVNRTSSLLTTNVPTVDVGGSVTFTAVVGGNLAGVLPRGQVKFMDGATLLGTGALGAAATIATDDFETPGSYQSGPTQVGQWLIEETGDGSGYTVIDNNGFGFNPPMPIPAGSSYGQFSSAASSTFSGTISDMVAHAFVAGQEVSIDYETAGRAASDGPLAVKVSLVGSEGTTIDLGTYMPDSQNAWNHVTTVAGLIPSDGNYGVVFTSLAAAGDRTTFIDSVSYNLGATATLTTTTLPVGIHNVTAVYPGNDDFGGSTSAAATVEVTGAVVKLTNAAISAPAIAYGANGSVQITISSPDGTPTGNVSLVVDGGAAVTQALVNGVGTFTLAGLTAGSHSLAASYAAEGDYTASSANGSITVNKAAATIKVTPYSVTYDGAKHTAVGTAKGVGGVTLAGLVLTQTAHTNAGTFATDAWTFHDPAGNYADASGSVSDAIARAKAAIIVTPYKASYDGTAHIATGSAKGVGSVALRGLSVTGTIHTTPGTYADTWTFADVTGNYLSTSGKVSDVLIKAAAKISVASVTASYDGKAHGATGKAGGVEQPTAANLGALLHLSYKNLATNAVMTTAPVQAGTYAVLAKFDGNANYAAVATYDTAARVKINAAVTFSNLSGPTIIYKTAVTTLSGKVGASGGTVSITVNKVTVTTAVKADGTFSANLATKSLPVGTYTIGYAYAGASATSSLKVTYGINNSFDSGKKFKVGETIPLSFLLTDATGGDVEHTAKSATATGLALVATPKVIRSLPAGSSAGGKFTPDSDFDRYTISLKTTGLAAGSYLLFFTVAGDAVTHSLTFTLTT